jgi:hypothetical protein
MKPIRREVARRQSSPYTGKLSARPAGKPGYSLALENLRQSLPATPYPQLQRTILRRSACVFKAWRNLSGPIWFQSQNQTPGWDRAASRWSAPSPGKRTRREDHAPSHRPQMSSGRLFLDRVARQQSPSPLHRHGQNNMLFAEPQTKGDISTLPARGHFYFALTLKPSGLTRTVNSYMFAETL